MNQKKENLLHKFLAGSCAGVTAAVLIWAVGTALYYRMTG
jgi:hypothetical protein